MPAPDRSFPNGSPVCDYWLSRCEGFTVRAGHRTLGVVESVGHTAAHAETIVVRKLHHRRRTIPAGDVLAVVPARKVLLARRGEHAKPVLQRIKHGFDVAVPVVVTVATTIAVVAWALASWVARELRRWVPRLTRLALAEIHDRNLHHGEEPGVGRSHRRANEYDYGL